MITNLLSNNWTLATRQALTLKPGVVVNPLPNPPVVNPLPQPVVVTNPLPNPPIVRQFLVNPLPNQAIATKPVVNPLPEPMFTRLSEFDAKITAVRPGVVNPLPNYFQIR